MSKELDKKQYQPFHGLAYMNAHQGAGGVNVYEFFEHVFNMDKEETDRFFQYKYTGASHVADIVEAQYELAIDSLLKTMEADLFGE